MYVSYKQCNVQFDVNWYSNRILSDCVVSNFKKLWSLVTYNCDKSLILYCSIFNMLDIARYGCIWRHLAQWWWSSRSQLDWCSSLCTQSFNFIEQVEVLQSETMIFAICFNSVQHQKQNKTNCVICIPGQFLVLMKMNDIDILARYYQFL